jgi:hypothetical protein
MRSEYLEKLLLRSVGDFWLPGEFDRMAEEKGRNEAR